MLSIPRISEICCKCFHTDVAKVDWNVAYVLQWLYTYVVSDCSKCFICLYIFAMTFKCFQVFCKSFGHMVQVFQLFRTYVVSASSRCRKSRSDVAHVAMGPTCRSRLLQLLERRACAWEAERWSAARRRTCKRRGWWYHLHARRKRSGASVPDLCVQQAQASRLRTWVSVRTSGR
jgi:hypothetical protein